jgi:hypothetical protein
VGKPQPESTCCFCGKVEKRPATTSRKDAKAATTGKDRPATEAKDAKGVKENKSELRKPRSSVIRTSAPFQLSKRRCWSDICCRGCVRRRPAGDTPSCGVFGWKGGEPTLFRIMRWSLRFRSVEA